MVSNFEERLPIMESNVEEEVYFGKRSSSSNQKDPWICPSKEKRLNIVKRDQRGVIFKFVTFFAQNWTVKLIFFGHCEKAEAFRWGNEQKKRIKKRRNWKLFWKIQQLGLNK